MTGNICGNISKQKGFTGQRGSTGPKGDKGEKGDFSNVSFSLDPNTGDLYYETELVPSVTTAPYIGKNGNWYVFDSKEKTFVDTGVNAQGDVPKQQIIEYVDQQTAILKADVDGLQQQIKEEAHFRGYLPTNAKIQALTATPNDFAYSAESGTKWIYDAENGWKDSGTPVPDQLTPASDTTPLINGVASVGTETGYARGDHRHPTDITRASVTQLNDAINELSDNVDRKLLSKLTLWEPNTHYKNGAIVFTNLGIYSDVVVSAVMVCLKDHISGDVAYPDYAEDFSECWRAIVFNANIASQAVSDIAGNDIYETYATKTSLSDIKEIAEEAKTIAKGRATGYVFDTKSDMDVWIADSNNAAKLVLGDNLYIRAKNIPDYWWDGSAAQELETQKVDLTEYPTKEEVENYITEKLPATSVNILEQATFMRCTVGNAGGGKLQFESSKTRITCNFLDISDYNTLSVVIPEGYKFIVRLFNNQSLNLSDQVYGTGEWETISRDVNTLNAKYLILLIAHTDNSEITLSEAVNVKVNVTKTVTDVLQKNVEEINSELDRFKANPSVSKNLPDYWLSYMNNKMVDINKAVANLGFCGSAFAFITDVHVGSNFMNSPSLLEYITHNSNIKEVICGGDIVTEVDTSDVAISELSQWMANTSRLNLVNVFGNHDGNANNQSDQSQIIPDGAFYSLACRQSEKDVVYENGKLYGYRDNNIQKIRQVFLNTGSPDSAVIDSVQIEWLKDKITSLDAGWTVVIFCHQFFTNASPSVSSLSFDANGTAIMNALDSIYDDAKAVIACVIAGHCHRDYSYVSSKGYPIIATTTDANGSKASSADNKYPTRTEGTITEQCFDLYFLNTAERTISTIRIGAGDVDGDRIFNY